MFIKIYQVWRNLDAFGIIGWTTEVPEMKHLQQLAKRCSEIIPWLGQVPERPRSIELNCIGVK